MYMIIQWKYGEAIAVCKEQGYSDDILLFDTLAAADYYANNYEDKHDEKCDRDDLRVISIDGAEE